MSMRNRMCLPVMCGSPFVRSKQKGFRCPSPRRGLWLLHTAGRVEAPGRRHAGWVWRWGVGGGVNKETALQPMGEHLYCITLSTTEA